MPRLKNEQLVDPQVTKRIGRAIGGTHWQADLARAIRYSKSLLTRALNASRSPDEEFFIRFRGAMIARIEAVNANFTAAGLPHADDAKTERGMKLIAQGCELLRSQQPAPVMNMIDSATREFDAEIEPKRKKRKKAA